MKNINADKIIWSGNTLDEMRRLLGGDIEIEFPDIMDRAGLDYPWPITVLAVNYDSTKQAEYVYVKLGFDEVPGASDYEVRISLVPAPPPPPVSDKFALPPGGTFTAGSLSAPITAGDRCIFITGDIAETPSGMFSTWTKIRGSNIGSRRLAIWIGSGVGTGNVTQTTTINTGFGVYGIHAIGFILRNSGDLTIRSSDYFASETGSVTPMSAPAVYANKDFIAVSAVIGKSAFLDRYAPSMGTPPVFTGFESHYTIITEGDADLYSKGIAGSCGRTFGGNVDGSFTMAVDNTGGSGEAGNIVFSWAGIA
jgi:hypothetical protein